MDDLTLHLRQDQVLISKLVDQLKPGNFFKKIMFILLDNALIDDIADPRQMVHYILVKSQIFHSVLLGHISQLILYIVTYPGELGLHSIVLISQFRPSFSEELQLLILAVDQQLVQMHVEIVKLLHQLRIFLLCPLQGFLCLVDTLPGKLQVALNHPHPVLDVVPDALTCLHQRNHLVPLVDRRRVHAPSAKQFVVLQTIESGDVVVRQALLRVFGLKQLRVQVDGCLYLFPEGFDEPIHLRTGENCLYCIFLVFGQVMVAAFGLDLGLRVRPLHLFLDCLHQLVTHGYYICTITIIKHQYHSRLFLPYCRISHLQKKIHLIQYFSIIVYLYLCEGEFTTPKIILKNQCLQVSSSYMSKKPP